SFVWQKANMYITPYYSALSLRNYPLRSINSVSYAKNMTYNFISSLLFTSGQNSGLLSIGHLLSAVSKTPATCSVLSVATTDRTGGIFTWATVRTLAAGTCTINWSFAGTDQRAATSTDMNITIR
ncbi:MAG: hypothetical protein ACKN90_00395, partial [Candidatus Nanopelagicaceae bacterium]